MEDVGYDNSLGFFLLVLAAIVVGGLIKWGRGERRPYVSPATRMAEGAARRAAEFAEHDDYAQERRGLGILEAEDHDALMHCFSRAGVDLGEDAPWEDRKALAWKLYLEGENPVSIKPLD